MLQVTFISSVDPRLIASVGWKGISFTSPFADIAILLNLNWLSILLYTDAFVSPFGTGVAFVATSARTLSAMTKNGTVPPVLGKLNKKYGIPRYAMAADLGLAMILVFFFRDWSKLATVVSISTFIAYLTGPVSAVALRKLRPNFKRPFKSNWLYVLAPVSFVLTSMVIYWAMWPTTVEVIFVVLLGLPLYFYYESKNMRTTWKEQLHGGLWMVVYLIFISLMSYFGSKGYGGNNTIKYPMDFVIVIVGSLIIYVWAVASRIDTVSYTHLTLPTILLV